ncbi:hypothetical protein [Paraconexibacter sp.]|uniref:hypothetical protein n=1 Tax=Paraconexibacter sp. TaxID=2949640 RepID=UPI0035658FCE
MPASATTALTTEPLPQLDDAWRTWPRGHRAAALRAAAAQVRVRLLDGPAVTAVRTVDLAIVGLPATHALGAGVRFGSGVRSRARAVPVVHRMTVARFTDLDDQDRLLVWDPRVPETPATDGRIPEALPGERDSVGTALSLLGIGLDDVDVCGFSHLHDQDPRLVIGTTLPVGPDRAARPPLFPNAEVVVSRQETDTLRAPHVLQRERYTGALHGLRDDRLREPEGSVLLGRGVALLATPGHTQGHRSLALRTEQGVWVLSACGHIADAWHPHLSRMSGVRRSVEAGGQEVLVGSGAEDPLAQHDAMVLERAVADAHHADPRWRCVLPVAEVLPSRRTWPARPTFVHGGLHVGVLHR